MDDDIVRRLREHADRLSSRFGTVELIRSAADALDKFRDFKEIVHARRAAPRNLWLRLPRHGASNATRREGCEEYVRR